MSENCSGKWKACTLFLILLLLGACQSVNKVSQDCNKPLIIAHRGASGYLPEHTLEAYGLAIDQGADYIEPDLVITKDGELVARHENELSDTTDVAEKFPDRQTAKLIDGKKVTGWFSEDFTLREIKTLRAVERLPYRSKKYDGQYQIPTFEEVIDLVQKEERLTGRSIGIAPEIKHSSYFKALNLAIEDRFIEALRAKNLDREEAKVMVQSFEVNNLKYLRSKLKVELVQLLGDPAERPADAGKKSKVTYKELATPAGLQGIAKYAQWVSPHKSYLLAVSGDNNTPKAILSFGFVKAAHEAGLKVVPYTFRSDKENLSPFFAGKHELEYQLYFSEKIDALFTDFPDHAIKARNQFCK